MSEPLPPRVPFRKAKIVCTLGPATSTDEVLAELLRRGMDVARLNFSHGDHAGHAAMIARLRRVAAAEGRSVAILADLQGPKIRTGRLQGGVPVTLQSGAIVTITPRDIDGTAELLATTFPTLAREVVPGDRLLLSDGLLELSVQAVEGDDLVCQVITGGLLKQNQGINLPGAAAGVPSLTAKDRIDLEFALEQGVDLVALSFVRTADDVAELKQLIGNRAGSPPVVAKLEKPQAIEHLDQIIELSDGLMVARGDLGVEMPAEDVPSLQKNIVYQSRKAGKPVIVATQMLESMINAPTPTRAEASDVATAVYDGADAVMLSAETASGRYPLEAVSMMDRIAHRVEQDPTYRTIMVAQHPDPRQTAADAITAAARQVAHTVGAAAIVTYTTSGSTTLRAARERPEVPILCLTSHLATARRLVLAYGTHTVHTTDVASVAEMVVKACRIAYLDGFAEPGQRLVITAGVPFGTPGSTNMLRIAWVEG